MRKNYNQNYSSNGGNNYNNSVRSVTTNANIQLETSEWKCDVSSEDIEQFLQNKIDAITDKSNGARIPVEVRAMQYNKIYAPIVLMLPSSVIVGRGKKDKGGNQFNNIPATFARGMNNPKSGKSILLDSSVAKAIKPYIYQKYDIAAMEDPKVRSKLQLSRQQLIQIRSFSKPKLKKAQGGREYVIILLDCLKILQDMLVVQEDNRRFDFSVDKVNKHSSGRCIYKVTRFIPDNFNKNFNGGYNLDNELSRMFMVGSRNNKKH